jgi:hypothetical protein
VNTRGSSAKIAAVPSPWWTSQSNTSTRRAAPSARSVAAVTARSFHTQKPLPKSRCAWWVPPARLPARPSTSAARAAASVPPTEASDRVTSAGDHGRPSLRTARSSSVPASTAST